MPRIALAILIAALAGCVPQRTEQADAGPVMLTDEQRLACQEESVPRSASCNRWFDDRPACYPGTPDFIDDDITLQSGRVIVDFAILDCMGYGIYYGTGVDRFGGLYSLKIYHPDAPGGLNDPAAEQTVGYPSPETVVAEPDWL